MDILLTGSVAYDYLMTFPGKFEEQILPERLSSISLSFLVDSMTRERGGIAPNIAYTLALLGAKPRLMATVGQDFSDYRAWLDVQGIDTKYLKVISDVFTASFFVTTDQTNAQIASFSPGAMGYAAEQDIKDVEPQPDLVVIAPNDPVAMKNFSAECRELGIPYLYDPSQQVARLEGDEIERDMNSAHFLFVNDYEFDLISKKTGLTLEGVLEKVKVIVITRGKDGADIYTDGQEIHIPAVPPKEIIDPTGVGDAFRGGFLAGYLHGYDWELCGKIGSLSSAYVLEQNGTQNHRYTREEFVSRFRKSFDDVGKLDRLLDN